MKEKIIKKTVSKAKPDIFFPYTLPRDGDDAVKIKTLSWKPRFGCRKTLYTSSKKGRASAWITHANDFFKLINILYISEN